MTDYIYALVEYALNKKLIKEEDRNYVFNQLLYFFKLDYKKKVNNIKIEYPEQAVFPLLDDMYERKLIESNTVIYKDLLSSKVMNIFLDKPSVLDAKFKKLRQITPRTATRWFYEYMKAADYIKTNRIKKNVKYKVDSKYGKIDITINLSKPEKDPKDIALASQVVSTKYPLCVLCKENEGFAGDLQKQSRDNIRLIKIRLNKEDWFFQYSPYSYFSQHAILLSGKHEPMIINKLTFTNILHACRYLKGYFFGSNADLPIVGGSILSHDHYQGGKYKFAIEDATIKYEYKHDNINVQLLNWPLSTIRLRSKSIDDLVNYADFILNKWKTYTNESINVISHTGDTRHNTITPIARLKKGYYELDLVLRNNRTTDEYPLGIFHPHKEIHAIKKENIGLIEVMGLLILPRRLKDDLYNMSVDIYKNVDYKNERYELFYNDVMSKIHDKSSVEHIYKFVLERAGKVSVKGLEHCGVFNKHDAEFIDFIKEVQNEYK